MVLIDAELATAMLNYNVDNRPMAPRVVRRFRADMENGLWRSDNCESVIMFSRDGHLINGQHRLRAIQECGKRIEILVAFGCDPELKQVIDSGKNRTLRDRMDIHGQRIGKERAALVNAWNRIHDRGRDPMTAEQASEFLAKHDAAINWAAENNTCGKKLCSSYVWVAFAQAYERIPNLIGAFIKTYCYTVSTHSDGRVQQADALRCWALEELRYDIEGREESYKKAVYCLKKYIAGEPVNRVIRATWDDEVEVPGGRQTPQESD